MRVPKFSGTSQGTLAVVEPATWVDGAGRIWKTLTILGRIKYRYPAAHALRDFVFVRDRGACVSCADTNPIELVLDHIISRRNGGSHHPSNLQTLCRSCNSSKVSVVDKKGLAA